MNDPRFLKTKFKTKKGVDFHGVDTLCKICNNRNGEHSAYDNSCPIQSATGYGKAWEKEMIKWNKKELISSLREVLIRLKENGL